MLFYGNNTYTAAIASVPGAITSFDNMGVVGPVDDQVIFYNDEVTVDVTDIFASPNGDVTVTLEDNTNPNIAEASLSGNILTITALTTMGQTMITLMGDDGVMTATDEFYVTVLNPNPNSETLEFAIEDTPTQQNYPNNPNPYDNTWTDFGWTSINIEEDMAIISMHITGDLFSDDYPSEGSLSMTSPGGTTILVTNGFTTGTTQVDFEVLDFITQSCMGEWIIYFEDSYGDGGHALYNGTFIVEVAGSSSSAVAPTNLEADVVDNDVHLTWEYSSGNEPVILAWDSGINDDSIGLTNGGNFAVASRWTPTELVNYHTMPITMISLFPRGATTTYTLKVWTGANAATEVLSQPLTGLVIDSWNEIVLDTPVIIDATDELWFGYDCANQPALEYPAGCDAGPAIAGYGDMISMSGGAWATLSGYGLNYNWNLQATANGRAMERHTIPEAIEVVQLHNELFSKGNLGSSAIRDRLLLGFKVYRDETEIAYLEDTEAREYDDMDITDGTYEFYVTAMYDTTESDPSNSVEVTIDTQMIIDPPGGLTVTGNGFVSWIPPGNILLVDDDGSIDLDFTDTVPYYEIILDASGYDYEVYEITTSGSNGPDADYMADYSIVIWECGEQWASNRSLTATDEAELGDYLDNDGYLVLCAHDYLWDRYPNAGVFNAGQFPYDHLGVASAIQDAFVVGESQGGPATVNIAGAGATAGMQVALQDIFSALRDGVYLDFLTPNTMGSAYSTYNGNNVGVQTSNTIFTTAGWAGLIDDSDTVLDYVMNSLCYLSSVESYNIYLDEVLVENITATEYQLTGLVEGNTYTVGLSAVYSEGESVIITAEFIYVPSSNDGELPGVTTLMGNYPNPFNPQCTIAFALAENAPVELTIYNVRGQKVRNLVNNELEAGTHDIIWNGTDDNGRPVSSGVYYYKMVSGKYTSSMKMVLMK